MNPNFFDQEVDIVKIDRRLDYFTDLCKNKKVLHFGCTDYPIFRPQSNLHIQLSSITKVLHGFDIDVAGINELKKYVDQPYFSDYSQLGDEVYDVCLIPETIEHVDNIAEFLKSVNTVKAKKVIITGPNAFAPEHMQRNQNGKKKFLEIVHPDHNCWFSPYTLQNAIKKYTDLRVDKNVLLERETMICSECSNLKYS
jgi:2-polyprenyl-3-methyl-5-hydroxy-6-metoxy-1,4-benzoquinol methylase